MIDAIILFHGTDAGVYRDIVASLYLPTNGDIYSAGDVFHRLPRNLSVTDVVQEMLSRCEGELLPPVVRLGGSTEYHVYPGQRLRVEVQGTEVYDGPMHDFHPWEDHRVVVTRRQVRAMCKDARERGYDFDLLLSTRYSDSGPARSIEAMMYYSKRTYWLSFEQTRLAFTSADALFLYLDTRCISIEGD